MQAMMNMMPMMMGGLVVETISFGKTSRVDSERFHVGFRVIRSLKSTA